MGAIIIQQLTELQQNYHTMEKELLSIVMVLEEFHSMPLTAVPIIYTNHNKLTFATLNCQSVLCWQSHMVPASSITLKICHYQ
ncbi:hypothetical protein ACHAXS_000189 [Conticribra weissflogii]